MSKNNDQIPTSFTFPPSERMFLLSERAELLKVQETFTGAQQRFLGSVRGLLMAHGLLNSKVNWLLSEDCSRIDKQEAITSSAQPTRPTDSALVNSGQE